MKRVRIAVFWAHLFTARAVVSVVFVMAVTGVLLTYQREITAWADRRGFDAAPPSPGSEHLAASVLLGRVERATRDTATRLTVRSDPDAAVLVTLGTSGTVLANAYTGEVEGVGSNPVREFFRVVTSWHRWLGGSDERRTVGRAVTGVSNLGFLFLVTSGFYLWWPRNWTWRAAASIALFRRGLSGKARDFNWHNTFGFWSAVPLFIVVLSGVVISFRWASDFVYLVVGEAPPASVGPVGGRPPRGSEVLVPGGVRFRDLDRLLARAAEPSPEWRSITVPLPRSAAGPVTFTIDDGDGGQPHKRALLTLDRETGEVAAWEPFSSGSPGRRLRSFLRFAPTGEVAGLVGQTIAGLASLGAAFLVWTGSSLAWRRFGSWRGRRRRVPFPP